jgi:uncharacterized protein
MPVRLTVVAHPGARSDRVELQPDGTVGVWVRARPIEGQANAAIERCLAHALGLRPRQVTIVSGARAHHKVLEVELTSMDEVHARLASPL